MIDQETRRKMRIIGVPEALDIMDAMAADPSYANMGFDEMCIRDSCYRSFGRNHLR